MTCVDCGRPGAVARRGPFGGGLTWIRLCADCLAHRHGPLEPTALDRIVIARKRDEQIAALRLIVDSLEG